MVLFLILLVVFALLANMMMKKVVLNGLSYRVMFSKKVVEIDEEFTMTSMIENRKMLPVPFLKVIERLPDQLVVRGEKARERIGSKDQSYEHLSTMMVFPFQRVRRNWKVTLGDRGRYVTRGGRLVAGDLLALSETTLECEDFQELVALPRKADVGEELVPYGNYQGDYSVRRFIIEDPILTIGLREYTGYEPMKTIHWPASLKAGQLMTKRFDHTTDNRALVLLNIDCGGPDLLTEDVEKVEYAFSLCRGVLEDLETSGFPYSLLGNIDSQMLTEATSGTFAGHGGEYCYDLIELLGRATIYHSGSFEKLLQSAIERADDSTSLILVTPKIGSDVYNLLYSCQTRYRRVLIISVDETGLDHIPPGIPVFLKRKEAVIQ